MDPRRFNARSWGRVIGTMGPDGPTHAYVPEPLPRDLDLERPTILAMSEAEWAIGRLTNAGRGLPDPHILVAPYMTREALASSRIEGTQASLSDVFDSTARGTSVGPSGEVIAYIRAMNQGLGLLPKLPISQRLVCTIHETLLADVRGHERRPGRIRQQLNWIGSPDNRPDTAIFVPPPVPEMTTALSEWERFANDRRSRLPPLIRCALLHYQFETIHPFLDGNGRLGRLLIVFFLIAQGRLPQPLLYTSGYLEQRRGDYYDRLQAVRERGEMQEWLQFFLTAVADQASDAVHRAEKLIDLRERYRSLATGRGRSHVAVDVLITNPIVTSRFLAARMNITDQGAKKMLSQLEEKGIVAQWAENPDRRSTRRWIAPEILLALEDMDPPGS